MAWSQDKPLDFRFSWRLVWLIFIVRLHFLANKNDFQLFFPLVGLILCLVVIKCWKHHNAVVHIETRNKKFLVSVPTSSQFNVESYGFSKHRSQFDRFIKRLKKHYAHL